MDKETSKKIREGIKAIEQSLGLQEGFFDSLNLFPANYGLVYGNHARDS